MSRKDPGVCVEVAVSMFKKKGYRLRLAQVKYPVQNKLLFLFFLSLFILAFPSLFFTLVFPVKQEG